MFHHGVALKFAPWTVFFLICGLVNVARAATFEIIGVHKGPPAMFRVLVRAAENARSLYGLDMLEVEMSANGQVRRVPGVSGSFARRCQRAGLLDLYQFELRSTRQQFHDSSELSGFERPESLICQGDESTAQTRYTLFDPMDKNIFVSWQCWLVLGTGEDPLWLRVDAGPDSTRIVLGGTRVRTAEIAHLDVELRHQGIRKRAAVTLKEIIRGPDEDSYVLVFSYSRPPLFEVQTEDVLVIFRSSDSEAQVLRPGVVR